MISSRIRELRKNHNLTQKDFADIMGMSRGAINKYETGERTPDIYTLIKFANYFGVSMDYLVDHKVSTKEKTAYEIVAMFDRKGLSSNDIGSDKFKKLFDIVNYVLDTYCNLSKK